MTWKHLTGWITRHPLLVLSGAVVLVTGLRLIVAASVGLSPDEAYYWQWSGEPALSYGDHPPMVAWLIHLSTWLLGDTRLGIRAVVLLQGAISTLLVYGIATELDARPLRIALATLALPMTTIGSIIITPDSPLAIAWLATIWAMTRFIRRPQATPLYLAAIGTGVAVLSKHSGILLYPLILIILMHPRYKAIRLSPHPWLAFLLSVGIAAPWIIGELLAGFPSISHQGHHLRGTLTGTTVATYLFPIRIVELLAGQLGLLTPLMAVWTATAIRRWKHLPSEYLPAVLGVSLPLAATILSAVLTHPEQNWASLGHPLAPLLAFRLMKTRPSPRSPIHATATAAVFTIVIVSHTLYPYLPLPPKTDPTSRLHGWEGLQKLAVRYPDPTAILCDNYGLAAQVEWNINENPLHPWRHIECIASPDRPSNRDCHRYDLLLEQDNDHGNQSLDDVCVTGPPFITLPLRRPSDGEIVRNIRVHTTPCTPSPP